MTFRITFKSADEALIFNHSRVQEREIHIVSLECFSLRIKLLFSGESTESMDGEKLSQMEVGRGGCGGRKVMVRTCRSRQHSSSDLHPNNSPPPPLPPQTSILPDIFSPPPFPFVSLQLRAPLLFSCPGDSTGIDCSGWCVSCSNTALLLPLLLSASRGRYSSPSAPCFGQIYFTICKKKTYSDSDKCI